MGRKTYSDSFKENVVLKVHEGQSVSSVVKETGVSWTSINKWVLAAEANDRERPATAAELALIKQLRKENRRLQEEKLILKKATALLVQWEL